MATHIETKIFKGADDVDHRLRELGLTREPLIRVVRAASAERANVTELHAANAAGTFAYHHGIAALRREFIGGGWTIDRHDSIESIFNEERNIKISLCNVDVACGRTHPRPRSDKGAGAERAAEPYLFSELKEYAPQLQPFKGHAFYYLMLDPQGRAELTRPVVSNGTFVGAVERILFLEEREKEVVLLPLDTADVADGFDPQIVRK